MKGTPLDLLQKQMDQMTAALGNLETRIRALESPPLTLAQRRRDGEMEGMTPGWPYWVPAADRMDDYKGLEESDCPRCGHHGQVPRYWHREETRQYASFAECPACRHTESF
jgi:hypothetical protein